MKKPFFYLAELFIAFFYTINVFGADFYVSSEVEYGSGSGTSSAPWKLEYAIDNIEAGQGHSIIMKPGIYVVEQSIDLPLGISLKGESDDATQTILRCNADLGDDALLRLVGQDNNISATNAYDGNQTVSYFTLEGQDKIRTGISVINRNNVKLLHLRVLDFAVVGISFSSTHGPKETDDKISGGEIAYCYVENSAGVINRQAFYYSGNIEIGGITNTKIHHNTIVDFAAGPESGYGLKSKGGGYVTNTQVYQNFIIVSTEIYRWGTQFTIETNNPWGMLEIYENVLIDGGTSFTRGPDNVRVIEGRPNFVFRDNFMVNTTQPLELYTTYSEIYNNYITGYDGSFVAIHTAQLQNVLIHHNILDASGGDGIHMKNSDDGISKNIQVYNNIFRNVDLPFEANNGACENIDVKNNVFTGCGTIWKSTDGNTLSDVEFDYNVFYNNSVQSSGQSPQFGDNNIDAEPLFAETLPYYNFFLPAESSPMVNAGVDVGNDINSNAIETPDIGFHEFGTTPSEIEELWLPMEISLFIDDVKQLMPVISPPMAQFESLTWETNDDAIVEVNPQGQITAKSLGSTTVTVTSDNGKSSSCKVNVVHVELEELNIISSAITLKVNQSSQQTVLFTPRGATDRSVTWSTADPSIATVTSVGTIVGKAEGRTTIYAKANDNGYTDSLSVIVSTENLPIACWKFNNSNTNEIDGSWPAEMGNGAAFSTESKEGSHSVEFSGGYEKIDINNEKIRESCNKRTIMMWVKVKNFRDTMELYEEGGSKGGLVLRLDGDKKIRFRAMDNWVPGDIVVDYTFENEWTHITAILDNDQIRLYLNGQLAASEDLDFSGLGGHTNGGGIGFRNDDDPFGENENNLSLSFDGYIDDVQLYDIVLSEQAINEYIGIASVDVTGVDIIESNVELSVGETIQLTKEIAPDNATNKNVTWKSDDDAVAEVNSNGMVTANATGTATITVTTLSGGFEDDVSITVGPSFIPAESITINQNDLSLNINQDTCLTVAILPVDANETIRWESSDALVATVDNLGCVTAKSTGMADIIALIDHGDISDTLSIEVNNPASVLPDLLQSNNISIYPNPVKNHTLYIHIPNSLGSGFVRAYLYNLCGKILYQQKIHFSENTKIKLPNQLNPGMYIFSIRAKDYNKNIKISIE